MKFLLPLIATIPALFAAPLSDEIIRNTARELDEILIEGLNDLNLKPNALVDDPTFLRRSYLNIIGRLPTEGEARQFLDSKEENKRSELIDTLVASPGLKSRIFNFWSDLLRLKTNEETAGLGWHVWLRNAVEDNMPYNQMVHAMLSAEGHVAENPAAGYYLRDRGMLLDNVSNTVQVFLGQQIGCAQCHDHPFDDTTQMEYYQLASFLGGTDYRFDGARDKIREVVGASPENRKGMRPELLRDPKKAREARKKMAGQMKNKINEAKDLATVFRYHNRNALVDTPNKVLKLPEDYSYEDGKPGNIVDPATLFGEKAGDIAPENRRAFFAKWATSPENPYFTKVIANRLWEYVFGYGLVADPDDWTNSPDPAHPELVTYIEKAMVAANYDIEQFLRILYRTQLFQREVSAEEPAQGFSFNFQGPVLRRMNAEELRDSFVTMSFGNVDGTRNYALDKSWNEYVESFNFVMGASAKELREIDDLVDESEKRRREFQKVASEYRAKMQKARESGDMAAIRKLTMEVRELQKGQNGKRDYLGNDSELAMKAQAAVARRAPKERSDQPEFRLRSSELPVPQNGGTFVAEFGGSDSESPSSAHTNATVPQTLRLLNGVETSLLTSRKNAIARNLGMLLTAEERLEFLYLTFYSAYPTAAEKSAFLPEVDTLASTQTFARAILTSNRFLFVQ